MLLCALVHQHTDDSIEIKYCDRPEKFLDKMAFSLTGEMGCEHGGGVSCAAAWACRSQRLARWTTVASPGI